MTNESAIPSPDLAVRTVALDAPWSWLAAGWRDLWRIPAVSLIYGALFTGIAYVLTACLLVFDLTVLLLPLAAGFMLLGPMLAVGLYEASRRLERRTRSRSAMSCSSRPARRRSLPSLAFFWC